MLRIVAISDTHGQHATLDGHMPDADILVHSGDLTSMGKLSQWQDAAAWLEAQTERYEHVLCIAGNHDFCAEAFMKEGFEAEMREKMFPRVHYLRDSGVTLNGKYFYGSPWSPRFYDWAFNADRGLTIKRYWDMIPSYADVVLTHGPMMGVLDRVGNQHVGCADLRVAIEHVRPRLHVSGHIHCGYGIETIKETTCVNASVCNEQYQVVNPPRVICL